MCVCVRERVCVCVCVCVYVNIVDLATLFSNLHLMVIDKNNVSITSWQSILHSRHSSYNVDA